jgi:hypothetical protein
MPTYELCVRVASNVEKVDEYRVLVKADSPEEARHLAANSYSFDDFEDAAHVKTIYEEVVVPFVPGSAHIRGDIRFLSDT